MIGRVRAIIRDMKLTTLPIPNFEAVIYDEQDRNAVDPSSSLGWFATAEDALDTVVEYVSDTANIYRWEVRNKTGVLLHCRNLEAK